jgi:hypothetical protein
MNREIAKSAVLRFLRVIIPQIPAIIAFILKVKPEWGIALTFVGAVATALDKLFRDLGWY